MTQLITFDMVVKSASRVINQYGLDYNYREVNQKEMELGDTGCKYRPYAKGRPGCLVGELLKNLGLPTPEETAIGVVTQAPEDYGLAGYEFLDEASTFLNHLQGRQDTGASWGEALIFALSILPI